MSSAPWSSLSSDDESAELGAILDNIQESSLPRKRPAARKDTELSNEEDVYESTSQPVSKKPKVSPMPAATSLEDEDWLHGLDDDRSTASSISSSPPPPVNYYMDHFQPKPQESSTLNSLTQEGLVESMNDTLPHIEESLPHLTAATADHPPSDRASPTNFDNLTIVEDAALERIMQQAEAEHPRAFGSVHATTHDAAEVSSPGAAVESSHHACPPAACSHQEEPNHDFSVNNTHAMAQKVDAPVDDSDEWVEDYLFEERQHDFAEPSPVNDSSSSAPSSHEPEAFNPSPEEFTDWNEEEKDCIQETLAQAEPQAHVLDPNPRGSSLYSSHLSDESHFAAAFGFSTPEPKNLSGTQPIQADMEDDELLELPTRGHHDESLTLDGIDRETRYPEVDPSLYLLPADGRRPLPYVHEYTQQSLPVPERKCLPVGSVFDKPQVAKLFLEKFQNFNPMQSELANMLAHSDDNIVLAAPTGAGKTAIFEMAMARFFNVDLQSFGGNDRPRHNSFSVISSQRKIVYISPSKALCDERYTDWSERLAATKLRVGVACVTGDGDPGEAFREIASNQLILTTPEKWDSVTRRWTENFYLLASVKLVLVDEIHLVADKSRGSCLETVITRVKNIANVASRINPTQDDITSSR